MLTVDFNAIGLKPGMRVLDAGCGSGRHLCEAFRTPGVEVAGVDLNWVDLCKAKGFLSLMAREKPGKWIVTNADILQSSLCRHQFRRRRLFRGSGASSRRRCRRRELVRVLKPGGDLVVTVPRFFPERVCWALSAAYHHEPGGHIRIYKKGELMSLLEEAGTRCWRIRYRHGLHAPYWWLRCLVGHKNERSQPVRLYRRFLEWDILRHPPLTAHDG